MRLLLRLVDKDEPARRVLSALCWGGSGDGITSAAGGAGNDGSTSGAGNSSGAGDMAAKLPSSPAMYIGDTTDRRGGCVHFHGLLSHPVARVRVYALICLCTVVQLSVRLGVHPEPALLRPSASSSAGTSTTGGDLAAAGDTGKRSDDALTTTDNDATKSSSNHGTHGTSMQLGDLHTKPNISSISSFDALPQDSPDIKGTGWGVQITASTANTCDADGTDGTNLNSLFAYGKDSQGSVNPIDKGHGNVEKEEDSECSDDECKYASEPNNNSKSSGNTNRNRAPDIFGALGMEIYNLAAVLQWAVQAYIRGADSEMMTLQTKNTEYMEKLHILQYEVGFKSLQLVMHGLSCKHLVHRVERSFKEAADTRITAANTDNLANTEYARKPVTQVQGVSDIDNTSETSAPSGNDHRGQEHEKSEGNVGVDEGEDAMTGLATHSVCLPMALPALLAIARPLPHVPQAKGEQVPLPTRTQSERYSSPPSPSTSSNDKSQMSAIISQHTLGLLHVRFRLHSLSSLRAGLQSFSSHDAVLAMQNWQQDVLQSLLSEVHFQERLQQETGGTSRESSGDGDLRSLVQQQRDRSLGIQVGSDLWREGRMCTPLPCHLMIGGSE